MLARWPEGDHPFRPDVIATSATCRYMVGEHEQAASDTGRAERARTELDALVDHLVSALGLGGRSRRAGGAAERARSAVTQRIRSALRRIDAVHPRLGRHLHSAVPTCAFCSYVPEDPVRGRSECPGPGPG